MDSIYLDGSEAVKNAGHRMSEAATTMSQAAANIQWAFEQHQRFLEQWLDDFREALTTSKKSEVQE